MMTSRETTWTVTREQGEEVRMMVKIEQEVRRSWTLEEFHLFYFMYCVVKLFH